MGLSGSRQAGSQPLSHGGAFRAPAVSPGSSQRRPCCLQDPGAPAKRFPLRGGDQQGSGSPAWQSNCKMSTGSGEMLCGPEMFHNH